VTAHPGSRRARIWRELKPFASLVPGLVAYGILRVVFSHVVGSGGFATPEGVPSTGLAVFALVMLVMRLAVLVLVPLIVTYRIVRRLFALGDRSPAPPPSPPASLSASPPAALAPSPPPSPPSPPASLPL